MRTGFIKTLSDKALGNGELFFYSDIYAVETTILIGIDLSGFTGEQLIITELKFNADKGPVDLIYYADSDLADGAPKQFVNRNLVTPKPSSTLIRDNPTIGGGGKGTVINTDQIPATQAGPVFITGAESAMTARFIVPPSKYLLEIINNADDDANIELDFGWIEGSEKYL